MKPKISIVIVTFKTDDKVMNACLKSIYSSSLKSVELIIVNNSPKELLQGFNHKKSTNLRIIQNNKNLGFGKANNLGIRIAKGKYILVLNPDIILMKNTLSKLFNFMEKFKDANMAGCKLINPMTKKIDDSARKFPTFGSLILRRLGLKKEKGYPLATIKQPLKVDWLSGAFLFMRKKYYFDENYFLYFEDTDLSRKTGKVYYLPQITAFHLGKRMSRKNLKYLLIHLRSMFYYFKKWKT